MLPNVMAASWRHNNIRKQCTELEIEKQNVTFFAFKSQLSWQKILNKKIIRTFVRVLYTSQNVRKRRANDFDIRRVWLRCYLLCGRGYRSSVGQRSEVNELSHVWQLLAIIYSFRSSELHVTVFVSWRINNQSQSTVVVRHTRKP